MFIYHNKLLNYHYCKILYKTNFNKTIKTYEEFQPVNTNPIPGSIIIVNRVDVRYYTLWAFNQKCQTIPYHVEKTEKLKFKFGNKMIAFQKRILSSDNLIVFEYWFDDNLLNCSVVRDFLKCKKRVVPTTQTQSYTLPQFEHENNVVPSPQTQIKVSQSVKTKNFITLYNPLNYVSNQNKKQDQKLINNEVLITKQIDAYSSFQCIKYPLIALTLPTLTLKNYHHDKLNNKKIKLF